MSLDALWEACEAGDLASVKRHAAPGASIDTRNDRGWNALIIAAFNQRLDVVRYLVEQCGADVNATNPKGTTVFMYAKTAVIESHATEILDYLLERGADINARDMHGRSVLDYVDEKDNGGMLASWLRDRGAMNS